MHCSTYRGSIAPRHSTLFYHYLSSIRISGCKILAAFYKVMKKKKSQFLQFLNRSSKTLPHTGHNAAPDFWTISYIYESWMDKINKKDCSLKPCQPQYLSGTGFMLNCMAHRPNVDIVLSFLTRYFQTEVTLTANVGNRWCCSPAGDALLHPSLTCHFDTEWTACKKTTMSTMEELV